MLALRSTYTLGFLLLQKPRKKSIYIDYCYTFTIKEHNSFFLLLQIVFGYMFLTSLHQRLNKLGEMQPFPFHILNFSKSPALTARNKHRDITADRSSILKGTLCCIYSVFPDARMPLPRKHTKDTLNAWIGSTAPNREKGVNAQLTTKVQERNRREIQSKKEKKDRWTSRGSNPRPSACKADALPLRHLPNIAVNMPHGEYDIYGFPSLYPPFFTLLAILQANCILLHTLHLHLRPFLLFLLQFPLFNLPFLVQSLQLL